jgi:hypothetical protein
MLRRVLVVRGNFISVVPLFYGCEANVPHSFNLLSMANCVNEARTIGLRLIGTEDGAVRMKSNIL